MKSKSSIGKSSKRKGNTYERRIADLLTESTGVNFRRVPASGGWNKFSTKHVRTDIFTGDLVCDRSDFLCSIEVKNRVKFSFESILSSPEKAPFTEWWFQCINDANSVKLHPLLFFKPDRAKDFLAIDESTVKLLKIDLNKINHFSLNCYEQLLSIKDRNKICHDIKLPTPFIFDWKEFSEKVNTSLLFKNK